MWLNCARGKCCFHPAGGRRGGCWQWGLWQCLSLCPYCVHTYAFQVHNPPLTCPLAPGGRAGGGVGQCQGAGQSPVLAGATAPEGFSTARGQQDMFCMHLGVFGVVVSVGDAISLFRLGVRS